MSYWLWKCDDGTYDICGDDIVIDDTTSVNVIYPNVPAPLAHKFIELTEEIERLKQGA